MGRTNDDYSRILLEKKQAEGSSNIAQEDDLLRQEMLDLVENLKVQNPALHKDALIKLTVHCKTGSENLATLPKFLQFLYHKIDELKAIYDSWPEDSENRPDLALIISALSICDTETNDCLTYRLRGRKDDDIREWGLEYIRHLAEELKSDLEAKLSKDGLSESDVVFLEAQSILQQITEFYMKNNCEIDAVDLYLDLDFHERLDEYVNENNVIKICRYLQQSSYFLVKHDYLEISRFLYGTYLRFNYIVEAFMAACRSLDVEFFHDALLRVKDEPETFKMSQLDAEMYQKQMCYILGHYGVYYCFSEEHELVTKCPCDELSQLIQNRFLINAHIDLAIELDILRPYAVDEICKIGNQKYSSYYNSGNLKDPVYTCLASAFVSGFTNAAFKTDLFLMGDHQKWLLTNSDTALMNCVACLGLLYMWDVDEAFLALDKFMDSPNIHIKAGALLALGVASANSSDPFMSHYALLTEYLDYPEEPLLQQNAIMAMGLAYAGTDDQDVVETLRDFVTCSSVDLKTKSIACLSIGMVACGSNTPYPCSDMCFEILSQYKDKLTINDPFLRLVPLCMGMELIGRYESIPQSVKELACLEGDLGKWCFILLKICCNCGTGNCTALQKLVEFIHESSKQPRREEEKPSFDDAIGKIIEKNQNVENIDITDLKTLEKLVEKNLSTGKGGNYYENLMFSETYGGDQPAESEPTASEIPSFTDESTVPEVKEEPASTRTQAQVASDQKKQMKKLKEETRSQELLQGLATIGVAFISLMEDISQKMALRLLNSFLQFGSFAVRRAVPVALGILSVSNPQITFIELLSKLSHDHDDIVSLNAIIALGIIGAGTNNSRIGNLLRNLNVYHHNEPLHVFAIRISQGLLHLSKGVMSMTPLRSEGTFLAPVGLASLLIHGVLSLDVRHTYLSKDPHMIFWLVPAMKLRALITYDVNGKSVPVTVRVGQAVDETGQAGKPKRITGFQTHRTPILLNVGERVELATNKYIPYASVLENIVLVKEDPDATGPDLS